MAHKAARMETLRESATIADGRACRISLLPVGGITPERFKLFADLIRQYSEVELRAIRIDHAQPTKFARRTCEGPQWSRLGIKLQFIEDLHAPDAWADFQPTKEVLGVVGICDCAAAGPGLDLRAAHGEFVKAASLHKFVAQSATYRLYAFDPPESQADLPEIGSSLVLIPPTGPGHDAERLAFYISNQIVDFCGQLIAKLDQWVTQLDTAMPVLQTSHDTVNIEESSKIGRRRAGRVHKYMADCAMLAGSPLDARELYQSAIEQCKSTEDRLWYASAMEGLCCAGMTRHEILQDITLQDAAAEGAGGKMAALVAEVREKMVDALDIYSRRRLSVLENE